MVQESKLWVWLALCLCVLIGSGTFIAARLATPTFEPLSLGWFRITLSSIVMLIWYRSVEPKSEPMPKNHVWQLVILGLLGITANQLLFLFSMKFAPAMDGALFYAFTPALVLIFGRMFMGTTITPMKAVGVLVALVGVILVLQSRGFEWESDYLKGDFLLLLAVITWALYTLMGKSMLRHYSVLRVNAWCFGIGALSLVPIAPWVLADFDWSGPGFKGWAALAYLVFFTSVLNFSIWYWALKKLEAAEVAVFANLQPPVTAVLAWWLLKEVPNIWVVIGGVLVVAGVTLVQLRQPRKS